VKREKNFSVSESLINAFEDHDENHSTNEKNSLGESNLRFKHNIPSTKDKLKRIGPSLNDRKIFAGPSNIRG
jgi:hypothetical protein